MVLAAGEGVRLQPITSTRPKHLIRVGGRTILRHCLDALRACGVRDIVIVTHYMSSAIREHFGSGEKLGLKIEYVEQDAVLGTGNALAAAEGLVNEDFLLVYGDLLFTAPAVKTVLAAFENEAPAAAMAVAPVENPEDYGVVEVEKETHVKRIVEKPAKEKAPSNLANAGIYVFKPDIFEKVKRTSASARGEWEIPDAIQFLVEEGKNVVAAKIARDDWMDIGRPWDLLEANRWALARQVHRVLGTVENGAHLVGPVTIAESARVRSGAYVEGPAYIGADSDIGPNCYVRPCTSIGKRVRVGNACEIKNSLIMDGVHIGHLSYVGDSVIGERCNLGAGTITANYRLDSGSVKMMVKDKVVDSGRTKLGTILGDDVKTGINSSFMPGVKVGCRSWVGPSVMVVRDLPAKSVSLLKQNLEIREG